MAAQLKFETVEKVPVKTKPNGDDLAWYDFIATAKAGTKYKMQFSLPAAEADKFLKLIEQRGFLYVDAWKEIK